MISFQRFRQYGRFGNQLFQYAFLRTSARRLGVRFFCPAWIGDEIFQLDDQDERAPEPEGIVHAYRQPEENCGYDPRAAFISDGTDILGYFQSPQHFDARLVRSWYAFRNEAVAAVRDKYRDLDFRECVGVHFRYGDMVNHPFYLNLSSDYYRRALKRARPYRQVLIFSDEPQTAQKQVRDVTKDCVVITGNKGYEDLYLLTQCRAVVCSVSTFSWWGGWLNVRPDKRVVAPREWIRPGQRIRNDGLICSDWIHLRAAHPIQDNYRVMMARRVWASRLTRARARDFAENLHVLRKFIVKTGRSAPAAESEPEHIRHKDERPDTAPAAVSLYRQRWRWAAGKAARCLREHRLPERWQWARLRQRFERRKLKRHFGARLRRLDERPIPDDGGEIRLFMTVRNGALRLPYLFDYYRRRGVDRFFVVDNDSQDDTQAFLQTQDRTHIFSTSDSYAAAECGVIWLEHLMDRHARGQWCVIVDADELLVYPGWEDVSLRTLCRILESEGSTALHSLLLDMYSDRPLAQTVYTPGEDFLSVCPYFETGNRTMRSDGYWEGGMRSRVFGAKNILSKHNLVKHVRGSGIGGGTHYVYGARCSALTGVTLHFKYFHDFAEQARIEAARGEHWRDGWQYRQYARKTEETPDLSLFCDESIRFEGTRQLIELGLMTTSPEFDAYCRRQRGSSGEVVRKSEA